MRVWNEGGVNQIMVGSILGYRRTKVSFWLVLVGLPFPFPLSFSVFASGVKGCSGVR